MYSCRRPLPLIWRTRKRKRFGFVEPCMGVVWLRNTNITSQLNLDCVFRKPERSANSLPISIAFEIVFPKHQGVVLHQPTSFRFFASAKKVCKICFGIRVSEQKNYCITKATKITLSRFVRILYYFVDNLVCDGFANWLFRRINRKCLWLLSKRLLPMKQFLKELRQYRNALKFGCCFFFLPSKLQYILAELSAVTEEWVYKLH